MEAPELFYVGTTVVFDLDGVLAEDVWPDRTRIGDPIPAGVALLVHIADQGNVIIIHTSRRPSDERLIWEWVEEHGLPVDRVICGKPPAAAYIDDRGYRFTPSTSEEDEIIETFAAMLRAAAADGQRKRRAGEKPHWTVDSHKRQIFSHLGKWVDGERTDPDSGRHPLINAAFRCLAVAWQEEHEAKGGEIDA